MQPKSSSVSKISMAHLVLPSQANSAGNMHGGEVMKLMDSAAGVVAVRHCLCNVVTVSVDRLVFKQPIYIGNLIICDAEIIYTGRTSVEIYVTVSVENLTRGEKKAALEGYFVMVALNKNGTPTQIPPLLIETKEQRSRFQEAETRIKSIKERNV